MILQTTGIGVALVVLPLLILLAGVARRTSDWRLFFMGAPLAGLVSLLTTFLFVYLGLPPLTGLLGGWSFLIIPIACVSLALGWYGFLVMKGGIKNVFGDQYGERAPRQQAGKHLIWLSVAIFVVSFVGLLLVDGMTNLVQNTGEGNMSFHASLAHVMTTNATMPPTDPQHLVLVTAGVAQFQTQQAIGAAGNNLGSLYHVSKDDFTLQSVGNHLYWIAPLRYNNFFSLLSSPEIPGFAAADAEDPNGTAKILTQNPVTGDTYQLHYYPGAAFGQDIRRCVFRAGYTQGNLADPTLEVDDSWNPYYTITYTQMQQANWVEQIKTVLLVDPHTCGIQAYAPDQVPSWVDRAMPGKLLITYLDDWGHWSQVGSDWPNFGAQHQMKTVALGEHGEPELLYNSADLPVWFVPMTSNSDKDQSSTGFMLCTTHEGRCTYYPLAGYAVGSTVKDAFSTSPINQQQHYDVSSVQLYVIDGAPTYVGIYTQSHGDLGDSFASIGFLDAKHINASNVIMATDKTPALAGYTQWLADNHNGGPVVGAAPLHTVTGKVKRIGSYLTTVGQRTVTIYRILLAGDAHLYDADASLSLLLPLMVPGDTVTMTFADTGGVGAEHVQTLSAPGIASSSSLP